MIENGLKPVYVFDGKPPTMKSGELEKRMEKRADAEEALKKAQQEGNEEEIDKQSRRLGMVTNMIMIQNKHPFKQYFKITNCCCSIFKYTRVQKLSHASAATAY